MQLLYDFLPVVLFFIVYQLAGIYAATGTAMLVAFTQMIIIWIKKRQLPKVPFMVAILILVFGGATLLLHKPIFIKWKPTIVYWLFSLLFLGSQIAGKKPFISYIAQDKVTLPDFIWSRLNISWGIFFLLIGALNLFVIYHYSTNTWVDFKLFGVLGSTILFVFIQAIYLSQVLKKTQAITTGQ